MCLFSCEDTEGAQPGLGIGFVEEDLVVWSYLLSQVVQNSI